MAVLQVNGSSSQTITWRRRLAWGLFHALAAVAVLAFIPFLFGAPVPALHIQWRDVSDAQRVALEQRLGLTEPTQLDGDVWSYVPADVSRARLFAIVTHPAVADTNGIDRRTFRISDTPPLTPRRGGLIEAPPWVAAAVKLAAYVLLLLSAASFVRAALTSPALRPESPVRRSLDTRGRQVARMPRRFHAWLRSGEQKALIPPSVALAAIALLAATLAWRFVTFTGFTNDHYVHLALAQQMLIGERPIRDFADSGWPLMYVLSAAAWRLAGDTLAIEWAIAAGGFAVGAACTIVAAYRLSASVAIAVAVTALEILIYPRTYSYPKVLVYAVAAWAIIALAQKPTRQRTGMMAGIVAVAFLFRHDHGLFLGVSAVVCLLAIGGVNAWRSSARRIGELVVATALLLLPWIVFVAWNGGILAYLRGGIEYSRAEAGATALTSLPTVQLASSLSTIANAEAWLFWLFWSVTGLSGIILAARAIAGRERWAGESAAVAALVTLAVAVNASFLRQTLQVRLPDAIVPNAVLGAWILGLCWRSRWRARSTQIAAQLLTLVIFAVSLAAVSRIVDLPGLYDNTDIGRGFARATEHAWEVRALLGSRHRDNLSPPSRVSRALMPFIGYLNRCTLPSERLIVTGEFPEILVIAGRGFAGDGVVFGSWYASEANQGDTVERLRARPPLFVLHAGDYDGFRGRFGSIDAFVTGAYQAVAEVPVEGTTSVSILVYRNRPPIRTDPQTGWPCYR